MLNLNKFELVSCASAFVSFVLKSREIDKTKIDEIILFGSVARGDFTEKSDVDIFVNTKNEEIEKIRDRLQASLDTVAQQLKENEFQEDLLKSANRPRIIHSTIMRFTKTPDDWENFESEWQTIINNFISHNPDSPLLQECLDVSSIHVVVEKLPYMQRSTKFAAPLEVLNVNLQ